MDLVIRLCWEGVQNLPLLAGFMFALELARQGNWAGAVGCIVAGAVTAAVIIRLTEHLIFDGHKETVRAMVGNIVAFSLLMAIATLYLTVRWTSLWTDILGGFLLAVALEAGQDLAARDRFGWSRCLALGLALAISILLIRRLGEAPIVVSILAATTWCTLVIGIYNEVQVRKRQAPVVARATDYHPGARAAGDRPGS